MKRKSPTSKEKEPEQKKPRLGKNSKSRDSVFAALCSTLSQAVLPSKKTTSSTESTSPSDDETKGSADANHQKEDSADTQNSDNQNGDKSMASDGENHREKEPTASRSCSDSLHSTSDNRQLGSEDCPLIPPKSSPEMAVNGT